jgi:hypothetical protein
MRIFVLKETLPNCPRLEVALLFRTGFQRFQGVSIISLMLLSVGLF